MKCGFCFLQTKTQTLQNRKMHITIIHLALVLSPDHHPDHQIFSTGRSLDGFFLFLLKYSMLPHLCFYRKIKKKQQQHKQQRNKISPGFLYSTNKIDIPLLFVIWTLAPASIKNCTASSLQLSMALISGVELLIATASITAPDLTSSSAISCCPAWQAWCRGVHMKLSVAFTSAL